jgi:hypothetical protein
MAKGKDDVFLKLFPSPLEETKKLLGCISPDMKARVSEQHPTLYHFCIVPGITPCLCAPIYWVSLCIPGDCGSPGVTQSGDVLLPVCMEKQSTRHVKRKYLLSNSTLLNRIITRRRAEHFQEQQQQGKRHWWSVMKK